MTQSGRYDRKIILGNKKPIKDNQGFQSYEIVPFANPWASVKPTTDQVELNNEKESIMNERVTFEIYYRPNITKNMYIIFKNKEYQITAIFNPGFEDKTLILTGEREESRGEPS